MESVTTMFFIATASLLLAIRLLQNITIMEKLFVSIFLAALGYLGYTKYQENTKYVRTTEQKVDSVVNLVDDLIQLKGVEISLPFKKVLQSDLVLLKAVTALIKFKEYDNDTVISIVQLLVVFFELYADILLEIKDYKIHTKSLVDLRFELLKRVHTLFVSLPASKHLKVLEYIVLCIQSSTYKCLNVLKNKYGTSDHEPPLAENMFDSSFEVF